MKLIVLATSNHGKFREMEDILRELNISLGSLNNFPGIPEAPEIGQTFNEIANSKASFYHEHLALPVLAEDSGLVIPSLGGFPGIYSARIAHNDNERIRIILDRLKNEQSRAAYYHCSVAFHTGNQIIEAQGRCNGTIISATRGTGGFGYDPIFVPENETRTFAEMTLAEKASYSHRGRALREILPKILRWAHENS